MSLRLESRLTAARRIDTMCSVEACKSAYGSANPPVVEGGQRRGGSNIVYRPIDFTKQAGIRTVNINEADLITCFANDYGYGNWVAKAIEFHRDEGDVTILISSRWKSPNMINAAVQAKSMMIPVIALTGFEQDNPLRQFGELKF